jgi:hypothetical protein
VSLEENHIPVIARRQLSRLQIMTEVMTEFWKKLKENVYTRIYKNISDKLYINIVLWNYFLFNLYGAYVYVRWTQA